MYLSNTSKLIVRDTALLSLLSDASILIKSSVITTKPVNTNSNLIETEADFFHIDLTVVCYPATAEKPAFRLWILQRNSQKSRILFAYL